MENKKECCQKENNKEKKERRFLAGILYGLTPHLFCIAFIVFTVLGTTTATSLLKPLMLNRYFFYFLVALSLVFATISAFFYLKRNGILSLAGVKRKWKYLSLLYGTTVFINLIFFLVIFPLATNISFNRNDSSAIAVGKGIVSGEKTANEELSSFTLQVEIPCSGHAPLISEELKKIDGVKKVKFRLPNIFDVTYDSGKTSKEQILLLNIFETYKAKLLTA